MVKYIKSELGGLRHFVRSHPECFKLFSAPDEKEFTVSLVQHLRDNCVERSSSYSASTDTEEDMIDYVSESESAGHALHPRVYRAATLPSEDEALPLPLCRHSSISEQSTATEISIDPYVTDELTRVVINFIRVNGTPDVPSRILGRFLATKGCTGCPNFLAYIKGAYGSLGGFITAHLETFSLIRYDTKKEFGVALVSTDEVNSLDLSAHPDCDKNYVSTTYDYATHVVLVRLVKDHLKSYDTTGVSSRDIGRILMDKMINSDGPSALQVLKDKYGSVAGFLRTEPEIFLLFKSPLNKSANEFFVKLLS